MIQQIIDNLSDTLREDWMDEIRRLACKAEAGERLATALEPFASGHIDVSETAVILGYQKTHQALRAGNAALAAWEEANK